MELQSISAVSLKSLVHEKVLKKELIESNEEMNEKKSQYQDKSLMDVMEIILEKESWDDFKEVREIFRQISYKLDLVEIAELEGAKEKETYAKNNLFRHIKLPVEDKDSESDDESDQETNPQGTPQEDLYSFNKEIKLI